MEGTKSLGVRVKKIRVSEVIPAGNQGSIPVGTAVFEGSSQPSTYSVMTNPQLRYHDCGPGRNGTLVPGRNHLANMNFFNTLSPAC